MKSERRHELRTNALAQLLERLPDAAKEYGGKILLGIIIVALLVVLVVQRLHTGRTQEQIAASNLAVARSLIADVRDFDVWQFGPEHVEQAAVLRQQTVNDAQRALDQLFLGPDDPKLRAEAYVAQGDLFWQRATMAEMPGVELEPELEVEQLSRDEMIARAAEAYQTVLDRYPNQSMSVIAARFGLAAIAENQSQWNEARAHYEAIVEDSEALPAYRRQAEVRLELLAELRRPPRLGEARPAPAAFPPLDDDPLDLPMGIRAIPDLDDEEAPPPFDPDADATPLDPAPMDPALVDPAPEAQPDGP